MCLEDLRLGRGRQLRKIGVFGSSQSGIVQPDYTRVALFFSLAADEYYDIPSGVYVRTYAELFPIGSLAGISTPIWLGPKTVTLLLRVEDFGQLVTCGWSVLFNTTGGAFSLSVVDIYSEVNAPPLDTYKP